MKWLIGLVLLLVIGAGAFWALAKSSQRGSAPGLIDGVLSACPSAPNCVSSEPTEKQSHAVEPLPLTAWDALPGAIEAMGGVIIVAQDDYIAAEFKTLLMGFVDDLEFRKGTDAVHLRSASRVGYSDRGLNKARVAQLRDTLSGVLDQPAAE